MSSTHILRLVVALVLLWPAAAAAQPQPFTGTTIKATDTTAAALCVGCPIATLVPAANSGARLATITIDPLVAPTVTTNKLYSISGALTWNGTTLATGSTIAGTTNTIGLFTGVAAMGNSIMTQAGTVITTAGTHVATSFTGAHLGSGAGLTGVPTSAVSTGNYVATVASGTGITSSVATGNAAATTISLNNTAVTPGAYGAANAIPTFTVDQQGRVTLAANSTITGVATITTGTWNAGAVTSTGPITVTGAGYPTLRAQSSHVANGGTLQLDTSGTSIQLYNQSGALTVDAGGAAGAEWVLSPTGSVSLGTANLTDATATPTLSGTCGSSTIAGRAYAFVVTVGAGGFPGCNVNFNQTFANAPICVFHDTNASANIVPVISTTVLQMVPTAVVAGDKIYVHCRGY